MSSSTPSEEQIAALRSEFEADKRSRAFVDLAKALNARSEHQEAAEVAHRGLLAHPDSVDGRLALALAESKLGRVREALDQIKRALLIDQENTEALALMGQILLERGLNQRAVQFLTHAVKLAPHEARYQRMLDDARAAHGRAASTAGRPPPARSRSVARPPPPPPSDPSPPVFGPDSIRDGGSPWGHSDDLPSEEEHTVFAADALRTAQANAPLRPPDGLDARLAALPSVRDEEDDSEPTRFATGDHPQPKKGEASTKFAAAIPVRRGKLGGSAAELSQVLRADEAEAVVTPVQPSAPMPPPLERAPSRAATPALDRPDLAPSFRAGGSGVLASAAEPAPSVPLASTGSASPPAEAPSPAVPPPSAHANPPAKPHPSAVPPVSTGGGDAAATPPPPPAVPPVSMVAPPATEPAPDQGAPNLGRSVLPEQNGEAAPAAPGPVSDDPKPEPRKGVGPVATRAVDDALFAILGRDKASASAGEVPPKPAQAPAAKPRVVRTSERFGLWTKLVGGLVLSVAAFALGYAAAVAPGSAAPEVVSEELKGVASELERGGLAALYLAEERIGELRRSNPDLSPLLDGAEAEVHARRFTRFGRAPKALTAARAALGRSDKAPVTVERAYALVLLSTATPGLEALDTRLAKALRRYPESPKAWVGRALIAERQHRSEEALDYLTHARAVHPRHRQTLLETARWLARRGAHASALETYALIQNYHDVDVEVAIERYVLGWATGEDTAHDEALAHLAGLVREEIPEVAKDETGRAALAFAVARFRDTRVQEALTLLGEAEGAFADSPSYQHAVGRILLAAGEGARAEALFTRAVELDPDRLLHKLDLARARYAKAMEANMELEGLRKSVARLQRGAPFGTVRLPYGTITARPGAFELFEVALSSSFFPEALLTAAEDAIINGASSEAATRSIVSLALARRAFESKAYEEAETHIREAESGVSFAETRLLRGRLAWAEGKAQDAAKYLSEAIASGAGGTSTHLELARAHAEAGHAVAALTSYETFFSSGGLSAEARLEEAWLRAERRDDNGALASLDELEALEPDHPGAVVTRAEIYLAQGQPALADETVERALKLAPQLKKGRPPEGVSQLSPALLTEVGRDIAAKDRKGAIALYKKALKEPSAPAKTHYYLGKALVASRSTRKLGRKELSKYLSLEPDGEHAASAERLSKGSKKKKRKKKTRRRRRR